MLLGFTFLICQKYTCDTEVNWHHRNAENKQKEEREKPTF